MIEVNDGEWKIVFLRKSRFRRLRRLEVLLRVWAPLWFRFEEYRFRSANLMYLCPVVVGLCLLQLRFRSISKGISPPEEWGWPFLFVESVGSGTSILSIIVNFSTCFGFILLAAIGGGIVFVRNFQPLSQPKFHIAFVCGFILIPAIIILRRQEFDSAAIWPQVLIFSFLPGLLALSIAVDKDKSKKDVLHFEKQEAERRMGERDKSTEDPNNPYQTPRHGI